MSSKFHLPKENAKNEVCVLCHKRMAKIECIGCSTNQHRVYLCVGKCFQHYHEQKGVEGAEVYVKESQVKRMSQLIDGRIGQRLKFLPYDVHTGTMLSKFIEYVNARASRLTNKLAEKKQEELNKMEMISSSKPEKKKKRQKKSSEKSLRIEEPAID